MPAYTLTNIISKFLKKITLTDGEKDEICAEIGAIRTGNTSNGGEGDEDEGKIVEFGALGELKASDNFLLYRGDSYDEQAAILWGGGNNLSISSFEIEGGCNLKFPSGLEETINVLIPDYSCTLAGLNGDGELTWSELPHVVTVLEVADQAERLAIPLESARNKIILDNNNTLSPELFVLKYNNSDPSINANWQSLGEKVTTSTGGNGSSDEGDAAKFGVTGGLMSTEYMTIKDANGSDALISLFCDTSLGMPKINVHSGLHLHSLVFPEGTAARTWTFTDAGGTIATSGSAVMLTGNQTVEGLKSFNDPVVLGGGASALDLTVTGEFIVQNKHSILFADATPVNGSVVPVDSGLEINLETGIYEICLFTSFNHNASGGARVKLVFSGVIAPLGGKVEIFTNGGTPTFNHLTSGGGGEGYVSDITRTGGTDSAFFTRVLYEVSDAGLLKVQYAQQASHASDTTMLAGSYIKAVTKFQ